MVTVIDRKCVGTAVTFTFVGKSTDEKPSASNGSKFVELDTGDEFFFDGDEHGWTKQADKYLAEIEITTAPTKVEYFVGEEFDSTGLAVKAYYTDDTNATITDYEIIVDSPLTVDSDHVTVKYVENGRTRTDTQEIEVTPILLESIDISSYPTKDMYHLGDALDLTGIEVTATYNNESEKDVTALCTFSPANGTVLAEEGDITVTVTYTEGEITKTDTTTVNVSKPVLDKIQWTSAPKVAYTAGEALDLTGAVITATYTDGTTAVVTDQCTFEPANGTTLTVENNRVTASYTENDVTKTSYKVLTVTAE